MKAQFTEAYLVEKHAIDWLKELGYSYIHGSELSPENQERDSYRDVILKKRFLDAVKRINPWLSDELAEQVYKKVVDLDHPDFVIKGKIFYEFLTNGVKLTFKEGKEEKTRKIKIIDFENPENNEFLIANQFTVECFKKDGKRIPDIVVFINGLPIAVFELKSWNSGQTIKDAFEDHKIKMEDIPQLYTYVQILVASDLFETKYGSPTSDWERFFVWEGIHKDNDVKVEEIGEGLYKYIFNGREMHSLEVLLRGLFRKEHLLEYIQDFVIYEPSGETYTKKIAMYHQFYAVKKAIDRTKECVLYGKTPEDRRIGVIWHTQGSGKSLTMLFYAKKALKLKELENPLLLFITDRIDLDEQLHKNFSFLPTVERAKSIAELQDLIKKTAGGVILTTIQKFGKGKEEEYPYLTDRKNIIVIADEVHRSQYRELARNLRKAIPNASFMGFTATPIQLEDKDTYLVFGEPISIYTIDKAKRHKVVVPIYYEARLVPLHLTNEFIDEDFEEISEGVSEEGKEELKRKYARLESLILSPKRLEKIAKDIVEHFNKRNEEIKGKAMIVTISRKVAVELYKRIKEQPNAPSIEVVISGNKSRDPEEFSLHIRNEKELENLRNDFKNPDKYTKMVIVFDMLLTGFDIPCLHTMYIDKPMKNHTLLQAIARVNRVFKDKPGGIIVDYIGIMDKIRKSLSMYTMEDIKRILNSIDEILSKMHEEYDIVSSFLIGIDYKNWDKLGENELANLITRAYDKIVSDEEIKKKFIKHHLHLKKLYLLASPHPETHKIKKDIQFFEMIKKMIVKYSISKKEIAKDLENEVVLLISRSISAQEPIDVFDLLKREKQDISILDENFLHQFKEINNKHYAKDVILKLLSKELEPRASKNPIRYKGLKERLDRLIENYEKKVLTVSDVLDQLIEIAKETEAKIAEGKELSLTEEELAFYDLLASEEGVFSNREEIMEIVRNIHKEITQYVSQVDWNKKERIKAKIWVTLINVLLSRVKDYKRINEITNKFLETVERLYAG